MFINIPVFILLSVAFPFSPLQGNVYMYYKLYGFHQNLYRYILSRSNSQLMGRDIKVGKASFALA